MSTTTAKITVHNPVTGELVENVTIQLFYNMQFVDGRRIVYVNGTGTFELDETNQVIGLDMLPFRPAVSSPVEQGPIDPQTGIATTDVVYPPGAVPADPPVEPTV
jgi:hypothetical protein